MLSQSQHVSDRHQVLFLILFRTGRCLDRAPPSVAGILPIRTAGASKKALVISLASPVASLPGTPLFDFCPVSLHGQSGNRVQLNACRKLFEMESQVTVVIKWAESGYLAVKTCAATSRHLSRRQSMLSAAGSIRPQSRDGAIFLKRAPVNRGCETRNQDFHGDPRFYFEEFFWFCGVSLNSVPD